MSLDYFTKLLEDDLRAVVKPQYVDQIPKAIKVPDMTVKALLTSRATLGNLQEVCDVLGMLNSLFVSISFVSSSLMVGITELNHILDRDIKLLSGGELQRFAIVTVCVQKADV